MLKALVYIENAMSKYNANISFQNIEFCHNLGVSIYVHKSKHLFT